MHAERVARITATDCALAKRGYGGLLAPPQPKKDEQVDDIACLRGHHGSVCGVELEKRAFLSMTRFAKKIGDGPDAEARLLTRMRVLARQRAGAQMRAMLRRSSGAPPIQKT